MTRQVEFETFEWDFEKERQNIAKHGLGFEEASLIFRDPQKIVLADHEHSRSEERWLCFGKVGSHVATVRFVFRGARTRILGAGFWRKGRKVYEKENPQK